MFSNIKSIKKHIENNMKEAFGSSENIMEEMHISTVIRNELFLANKDWIKGYKTFAKEHESKGGFLKLFSDIKTLVTTSNPNSQREQFLNFSKKYRKFLQKSLYMISKDVKINELKTEDFKELLMVFPEIVICLNKEIVKKNNWQSIILSQLVEEFKIYSNAMNGDDYGRVLKIQRLTNLGSIIVYSSPKMDYFALRNYLVLQNALLTNLEILDENAQENPFIYINAFTKQEEVSNLNKEYMIGLRTNINQKIFNTLNLKNNSVFFGFIHLKLIKDNLEYILKDYEKVDPNKNLFQNFLNEINNKENQEGLNLSLMHEISQYMNIDSEDCKWNNVSSYAIENILFLLKNTRVQKSNQGVLEFSNDIDPKVINTANLNTMSLYAKIIMYAKLMNSGLYVDVSKKETEKKIFEFIVTNFKFLNKEQKVSEYKWMLENITFNERFDIVLTALSRDYAIQDKKEKNNDIPLLIDIFLKDFDKYKHRFSIDYTIWLNRFEKEILVFNNQLMENEHIINFIPQNGILVNKLSYVNTNLKKISNFLNTLITEDEQEKFFLFVERINRLLLGTSQIREILSLYKTSNQKIYELINALDENSLNNNDIFRDLILENELNNIVLKEQGFYLNQIFMDKYLKNQNEIFKGIKLKSLNLVENENKINDSDYTTLKINHFLYSMTYEYIGEAAFAFENDFSNFINTQRNQTSFENIKSQEILFFVKDWIYKALREGYLNQEIESQEKEKEIKKLEEQMIELGKLKKEKTRSRQKI